MKGIKMRTKGFNITATILLVAIVAGFVVAQPAHADERTNARIKKLESSLKSMQSELAELNAGQGSQSGTPAWVQNISLFGDLRYRHEQINDRSASEQRDRNRIRARVGLKVKLNNEFDAIFGIASGSSDSPTSTNQSLGDSGNDSFSSKELWLDLAYFDWHPESMPGLKVLGGKMKQPFYKAGKNQLMWDGDIRPEGIVGTYKFDLSDSTTATFTGGGMWIRERSTDADTSLWGAQAYVNHKLTSDTHVIAGASYYDLGNIQNRSDLGGISLNGNTNDGAGGYEYDFNMIEGFVEYGFPVLDLPSAVFASYIENDAALSKENRAYFIGCRLNKSSNTPGSWQLGYDYREVDADAVVGGLTDSDVFLGGTGGRGHKFGFKYQLAKNVTGSLAYYMTERDDRTNASQKDHINLLHADLIFKF